MSSIEQESSLPSHTLFAGFPSFWNSGSGECARRAECSGASVLVGIVAGAGGIVFSMAGQAVVQIALEGVAGYHAAGPEGEVKFPWVPSFTPRSTLGFCFLYQ